MKKDRKTSISKAQNYKEAGKFWSTHDLASYWDQTRAVEFEVALRSKITYYAIDGRLSKMIQKIAKKQGISPGKLVNMWIQEKLLRR